MRNATSAPFSTAPVGLLAAACLQSFDELGENLAQQGFACDCLSMSPDEKTHAQQQFKTVEDCAQDKTSTDLNEVADMLDAMTSSTSLGDRILFAIERRENKESSKSALARAIGVTPQTLAAMCRPTYSRPEDWAKIKLLAIETGWSFLWLRDGAGRVPAKMEQGEAESLRLELSGGVGAVAAGAAQQPDSGQPGRQQIDPFLFAQVIGAIEAHPRRINHGWTSAVTIPCAIAIYNATVSGQITSADWAEFIQTYRYY